MMYVQQGQGQDQGGVGGGGGSDLVEYSCGKVCGKNRVAPCGRKQLK